MDIPNNIGKHCSLSSCNELDFLPITCNRCDNVYCKNHVFPDYHQCPSLSEQTAASTSAEPLQKCALNDCHKLSLESFVSNRSDTVNRLPALCSECGKSFCVAYVLSVYLDLCSRSVPSHRHPSSHQCSPEQLGSTEPPKNEAARALLAKHFPSIPASVAPSLSNKPKTSDPKKLAQIRKVELMKMRHRAAPGDPSDRSTSAAIGERTHMQVSLEGNSSSVKVFWFRKVILVLGEHLDIH
jgi:hypothetical protein